MQTSGSEVCIRTGSECLKVCLRVDERVTSTVASAESTMKT